MKLVKFLADFGAWIAWAVAVVAFWNPFNFRRIKSNKTTDKP